MFLEWVYMATAIIWLLPEKSQLKNVEVTKGVFFTLYFQCRPDCSGHGTFKAEAGKCLCNQGFTGADCSVGKKTPSSWFLFNTLGKNRFFLNFITSYTALCSQHTFFLCTFLPSVSLQCWPLSPRNVRPGVWSPGSLWGRLLRLSARLEGRKLCGSEVRRGQNFFFLFISWKEDPCDGRPGSF